MGVPAGCGGWLCAGWCRSGLRTDAGRVQVLCRCPSADLPPVVCVYMYMQSTAKEGRNRRKRIRVYANDVEEGPKLSCAYTCIRLGRREGVETVKSVYTYTQTTSKGERNRRLHIHVYANDGFGRDAPPGRSDLASTLLRPCADRAAPACQTRRYPWKNES